MKKLLTSFIMVMVLFAFTACGSNEGSGDGSAGGDTSTQSAAASEPTEHNTLSADPSWPTDLTIGTDSKKIVYGKLNDYKSRVKNNLKEGNCTCMTDEWFTGEEMDQAGIVAVMDDNEDAHTCYVLSNDVMFFPEKPEPGFFPWPARLQTIEFDNISTEYVTDMSNLFSEFEYLETLDLSSFDTSNVTDMSFMFQGCTSLKTLNLSGFDTSNVADMFAMFADCQSLETLDLTGFKTPSLENMEEAFRNCDSLTELDLSSFDGSNLPEAYHNDQDSIFLSCDNLSKVYVSQSLYDALNFEDSSLFKGGKEVVVK